MQLEKMTAQVRPRQPWEAVDLGFMMVQSWWGKILLNWVVITLPIFILINLLLPDNYIWAALIFWWLKPIYDRIPLHILSRTLFGEVESNKSIIKSIPGLIFSNMIKMLTYLRLDPSRSFNMPVWQLEKLKGQDRVERTRVLNKKVSSTAFGLMFMCILIEIIMFFSLIGLVLMFTPDYYTKEILTALAFEDKEYARWSGWVINGFIYISYLIVEPFYVAGGFALYINRRTQLEGWDIEIIFRQLANRVKNPSYISTAAMVLVICVSSMFMTPDHAMAEQTSVITNAEAKKAIDEIMATDDFKNKEVRKGWRWKDKPDDKEDKEKEKEEKSSDSWFDWSGISLGLGSIGELVLWIVVVALIGLAIMFYLRWSPISAGRSSKAKRDLPKSLFGLEITPESLPDDVGLTAMQLWKNNDPLKALSLLYRGALTTLVHRDGINLKGSATEGDCIRIVQANGQIIEQDSRTYFTNLTRTWQLAAYGHRLPDESAMLSLTQNWGQHFG